ncbi:helix-turn-helix domain-containing protein [Amycolatopsis sp. DG1A-15b]|uniref:helix-turn-helix domain-containing protein n=1 Tax=Amycolatopsis sp. DG1A-15b TaxID=3052846 RepID=UPI00255B85BB|nr:helix-turn-helix domain-containing protein [Amycolatopsis sp. DG1A-15b]WIX88226.1 helix-turn-helix domain-containing protein [Amycolatopsis sp. DG1A-15b]
MKTDDPLHHSNAVTPELPRQSGPAGSPTGDDAGHLLYTPAAAAERLTIGESWLRRKAGQRLIPCTFVGKHLRFSDEDLRAIVAAGRRGPSQRNQAPSRPGRQLSRR